MYLPDVNLRLIERYLKAADGWGVLVDIDASEEGFDNNKPQNGVIELLCKPDLVS